jgi:CRP-like cAMP-binding protein
MITIMLDKIFSEAVGARTTCHPAGAAIFRQGAPARAVFRVRSGCVEVVRHLADGSVVTIARPHAGDTFAEAALFADRYHCDALAQTDCEIDRISTATIRDLIADDLNQAQALAAFFAGQVRELRARIEILRIKRASDRLLAWLRSRATGNPLTLKMQSPWTHVAAEIGLTPEALYRALRVLETKRQIRRLGGSVIHLI